MKDADQIAAEAAEQITQLGREREGNLIEYPRVLTIIKSAIEKDRKLRPQPHFNEQVKAYLESRAAHASDLPFDVIDSNPNYPDPEQPEADFVTANHHPSCKLNDQDLMWVCAQCGLKVPAHAGEIPETLPCPSCGARDHDLEIKVGILKARASEHGAYNIAYADAEFVLRWLKQCESPPSIIALQERVCAALSQRQTQ